MNHYKKNLAIIFLCIIPCSITASSKLAAFLAVQAISSDNRYKSTVTSCQNYAQAAQEKIVATAQDLLKAQTKPENHTALKRNSVHQTHQTISRDQALRAIEQTLLTAYEDEGPLSPEEILRKAAQLSQYLDPEIDKDKKEAINFVAENSDKFTMFHLNFWWQAWNETGILKKFPIPEKIRKTPHSQVVPRLIYRSYQIK